MCACLLVFSQLQVSKVIAGNGLREVHEDASTSLKVGLRHCVAVAKRISFYLAGCIYRMTLCVRAGKMFNKIYVNRKID